MPAMPLGTGNRCCLQHRARHGQKQLHRIRALPKTQASSNARAEFVERSRQPWFVGMLLLLPTVKIGEAATEVSPGGIRIGYCCYAMDVQPATKYTSLCRCSRPRQLGWPDTMALATW